VHKLGFGSYSTTWLARDEETAKYVAPKIAVPDYGYVLECDMLRLLGNAKTEHPGRRVVPRLLDEFRIKGPNGTHRCLVTPAARVSISEAREASYERIFQPSVVRAIAAQLV